MVSLDHCAERAIIHIHGRFDYRCVRQFHDLMTLTSADWVVDLSKVDYVDSSALGMLLLLREHASGGGAAVTLRHGRGQVRDVLVMAKFDRMFRIED